MYKDAETRRFGHHRHFMARLRLVRFSQRRVLMAAVMCCTYFITFHGWSSLDSELNPIGTTFESANLLRTEDGALQHMNARSHTRMKLLNTLQRALEQPVPFLLVTGERATPCKTQQGSHLMMKSYKNKVDYCNLHGCKVWYTLESWEQGMTGTWARYPILKRLMRTNPSIEWFMWMDSDAMFTDMAFSIPFDLYNEWNKNLIIPGYWEKVYADDGDWLSLNAGIFLLRNCEWSQNFLGKWADFGRPESSKEFTVKLNVEFKNRPKNWPADDQSALVYLLRQNRTEHEQKAFLEASYSLHGFWEYIVDSYESMLARGNSNGKDKWPFITHFCGCKLCSGEYATWKSVRCIENFERAYHFADNQVLALAGMRHLHLSTPRVVPIAVV
ncbi:hypothetical protein O6H91_23G070600 [Diphasiastrum complanatum]|uniref:Uncharacterized protein n=2 Tax=Diphasiastrum complanatum TaxID=34168 RepID=A0ACC2AC02_DIPCM|nr:hypothetical protein O6H91_23G070600 [Diphasiastrum complanatum]KAJ7515088.1 hypothetical protein O6H91_23G070600 [Diphasiastrum complanatum]